MHSIDDQPPAENVYIVRHPDQNYDSRSTHPRPTLPKQPRLSCVHAAYDFDVLVPGHLTRIGTKADVQVYIDFFQHVLEGAKYGIAEVPSSMSVAGTGIFTPGNVNAGNLW